MRTFLFSLLVLVFAPSSEAQQVRLDPTGDFEALTSVSFPILGPNHYLVVGSAAFAPSYNEHAWAALMLGADTIWSKVFAEGSRFNAVVRTQSGHAILAGYTSTSLGTTDGIVVCLNLATGMVVWSKVFGTNQNEMFEDIVEWPDESLRLIGTRASGSNRQWMITKLASDGTLVWAKQQPALTATQLVNSALVVGDSLVVCGTQRTESASSSKTPVIRIFDDAGNELFHRAYGSFSSEDNFVDIAVDDAGGYMLTTLIQPTSDIGTIHLDASFEITSTGSQSLAVAGSSLLGGRITNDPAPGSNFFVSATIFGGVNTLASVVHLEPGPDWSTTFSAGLADNRPGLDGSFLRMIAATVSASGMSNGQTIVSIPSDGPSTPLCSNVPPLTFTTSAYPLLEDSVFATGIWFDPILAESTGADAANLTIIRDVCDPTTLPIELVEFTALADGLRVALAWQTATEKDNDYFTIERSADGTTFKPLFEIDGAGNSQSLRSYKAYDDGPLPGTSYYRLRQTDYDGASTLSSVVPVEMKASEQYAYPNPATAGETIRFAGPFEVRDMQGRIITLAVDAVTLPTGTYVFRSVSGTSLVQVAN